MLLPRLIPCLLLEDGGLVKTVRFGSPKYVGDPVNAIKIFNDKRVDELIFLDISASRERRQPNYALVKDFASECFMPLAYGGGITTVDQAKKLVGLGVEKVIVNRSTTTRPGLVAELAAQLGSQSVVASIDVKKNWLGKYRVYDSTARKVLDIDPVAHAERMVELGAGEIMVNSVERDGTQSGYDVDLVRGLTGRLRTPVIACGGAGTLDHVRSIVVDAGASAAAAGSMFVFQGPHRAVLISYPRYPDIVRALAS